MNVNSCAPATHGNNSEIYCNENEVTRDAGVSHVIPGLGQSPLEHTFHHGLAKLQQWSKLGRASYTFPQPPQTTRGCQFGLLVTSTASPSVVANEILNELGNTDKYEVQEDVGTTTHAPQFAKCVTLIPREFGERLAVAEVRLYHGQVPSQLLLTSNFTGLEGPPPTGATAATLSSPRMEEATVVDVSRLSGAPTEVSAFVQRLKALLAERFLGYYDSVSCFDREFTDLAEDSMDSLSEAEVDEAQHLDALSDAVVVMAAADHAGLSEAMNTLWQLSIEHPFAFASLLCRNRVRATIAAALKGPAREPPILAARLCERLSQFETPAGQLYARAQLCAAAAIGCSSGSTQAKPSYVVEALSEACSSLVSSMEEVLGSSLQGLTPDERTQAIEEVHAAMMACSACDTERISHTLDERLDVVRERLVDRE